MTKIQFTEFIKKYREVDANVLEAESKLGFEMTTAGVFSDLFDLIYEILLNFSNCEETEPAENNFYDELGKLFFMQNNISDKDIEEFYERYYAK